MITPMTRSLGDPILELRAKLGKCFGQDVRFVTEQINAQFIELEVCLYHIEQCELRGRIIEMKPWLIRWDEQSIRLWAYLKDQIDLL